MGSRPPQDGLARVGNRAVQCSCQQVAGTGLPHGFALCLPEFHKVSSTLSPHLEDFPSLGPWSAEPGARPQPG